MSQHVLICLPTYSEEVHINFAFSLMDLTRELTNAGITYETLHVASSHIIRARNFFANYFLNRQEFSHLLFLDTDMKFPAEAVLKLLAANKTIAGAAYPFRRFHLDRAIEAADTGLTLRDWLEKHADYIVAPVVDERETRISSTDLSRPGMSVPAYSWRIETRSKRQNHSPNAMPRRNNMCRWCLAASFMGSLKLSKKTASISAKTFLFVDGHAVRV